MTKSLTDFVEAIKSDPVLKSRVSKVQQDAMADIRQQADAIAAVARDAGFDLSEWAKRPTDSEPTPELGPLACSLTCCLALTSTV